MSGTVESPTQGQTITPSPTRTAETTPEEWTPSWQRQVPEEDVLGLTRGKGGDLYAVLSNETGPSAVSRLATDDGAVVWRTSFEGEPVTGSYAGARPDAREHWGATVGSDAVYSVHGGYDWTTLHAVDRRTGEVRWSDRRRREIAVHGIAHGTVVATASEFARPPTDGPTTEEPRRSMLLAYDASTGTVRWSQSYVGMEDVAVAGDTGDGAPTGDTIYVAAGDRVVAVGLDGTRRFQFGGDRPARTVRVTDSRVYYVAGTFGDGSTVHGLDSAGTSEWSREVAASEFFVGHGRLYVGGDVVAAVDEDGTVAWRVERGGDLLVVCPEGECIYTRTVQGTGEVVTAYSTADGRRRFAFDPPGTKAWPTAATPGNVVVEAREERSLWAVDSTDAGKRRRHDFDAPLFTVTTIGKRVFVGDTDATIAAFDA